MINAFGKLSIILLISIVTGVIQQFVIINLSEYSLILSFAFVIVTSILALQTNRLINTKLANVSMVFVIIMMIFSFNTWVLLVRDITRSKRCLVPEHSYPSTKLYNDCVDKITIDDYVLEIFSQ